MRAHMVWVQFQNGLVDFKGLLVEARILIGNSLIVPK